MKQKIQEKEGIPLDQQCLTFAGKRLKDWQTLRNLNIEDESIFYLVLPCLQIFVKSLVTGKTITLEVDQADSIDTVKQMIQNEMQIPTDQQLLKYSQIELEDGYCLLHYNIKSQSTIILAHTRENNFLTSTSADDKQRMTTHNLTDEACSTAPSAMICRTPQSLKHFSSRDPTEQQELSVRLFLENVATAIPDKWQMVGFELDLSVSTIRTIEAEIHGNLHRSFAEVFDRWQKHPTPQRPFCWDTVVKVLKSAVIDEPELARKIAKDFIDE